MALLANDRIELRAPEPEDLEVFYKWENDTELWKYGSTLAPYSRYELKQYLSDRTRDIYQTSQLRFMIRDKAADTTAGIIDLYDFDPHHRRAGIGILIDREFRRVHRASMAVGLLCEYAFSLLHIHQLFAHVPVSNFSSMALFEKSGFVRTGILKDWICTPDGYADICVMQKLASKQPDR